MKYSGGVWSVYQKLEAWCRIEPTTSSQQEKWLRQLKPTREFCTITLSASVLGAVSQQVNGAVADTLSDAERT